MLLEDRTVNRLVRPDSNDSCEGISTCIAPQLDSFNLWKTVCSSKLLSSIQFILLLNKTDILDARLKAGVQFASYVKSYRGENDLTPVTECEPCLL